MLNIVNKTKHTDLERFYPLINKYYQKTLKVLKITNNYDLSLIIVGPRKIKEINREYRNIDKETDVLSFALFDRKLKYANKEAEIELGDIFINYNRVISQAKEYKHSIKREFVFLFVHGLLHLLGYDHMKPKDEKEMLFIQKKVVKDL